MIYSIDTSALIHCYSEKYPPDSFPSLWDRLTQDIEDGILIASIEVFNELQKKDTALATWAKQNKQMFHETDLGIQKSVKAVLSTDPYQLLVNNSKDRTEADVFVIALAMVRGAIVVTEENRSDSNKRPKIPDVCDKLNIQSINTVQYIIQRKWRF